jgi:archaemetzincin
LRPSNEYSILLSPAGSLDAGLLKAIAASVPEVFHYPTRTTPLMDDYFFAFDRLRSQFLSTAILQALARAAPPDAIRVLAIVEVDLFIPILTHVYGEAQLGGKACIVSTYRLKDGLGPTAGHSAIEERSVKEALHELGHTFNLRHCKDRACIMHYCHTVRDVDRKENQLCRYCRILLEDELKRLERRFPPADHTNDEYRTRNIE